MPERSSPSVSTSTQAIAPSGRRARRFSETGASPNGRDSLALGFGWPAPDVLPLFALSGLLLVRQQWLWQPSVLAPIYIDRAAKASGKPNAAKNGE